MYVAVYFYVMMTTCVWVPVEVRRWGSDPLKSRLKMFLSYQKWLVLGTSPLEAVGTQALKHLLNHGLAD